MSNMQDAETRQENLVFDEIVKRLMAIGIGAQSVFALVDADDAEVRFAVVDDTLPDGGYVKAFPLVTGKTYLIVPLVDGSLVGTERGMNLPKK